MQHCGYGAMLPRMLRDQLVVGINNGRIQSRLLEVKDLTFENARELAVALETATRDLDEIRESKETPSQLKAEKGDDVFLVKESCVHCGRRDHLSTNCFWKTAECRKCGGIGHISPVCRSNKSASQKGAVTKPKYGKKPKKSLKVHKAEEPSGSESSSEETFVIYADIHGTSGRKNLVQPYTVDLLINGATTRMELDTGASVSLISEGTYDEWGSEAPPIQPANTVLRSYAGSLIPTLGKLNLQVGLRGSPSTKVLPVLLVKGNGPDLLGRDWLSSLRLDWREVHRLSQEEEDILAKFPQVFSEKLGEFTGSPARIVIDSDVEPRFCKVRTVPYNLRELVDDELKRLEAEEILSPVSYSEWATPIVPVLKSDKKSVRICGDFKQTCNRAAKRDSYPIPRVEDILAQLGKGKFFSKLDLSRAYNQIPLDEQSKPFTTITTQRGLYQFNRLPFGISAAPAIFQRLLEDVLRGLPNVVNYLDDILIAGATRAEHNDTLSAVLERLQRAGLSLKRSKCDFFKSSVVFLGHEISQEGIQPIREKVAAVLDAPSPTTVEELRSFSGAVNFYAKFLPNLSGVMAPLYELLQKGVSWHWGKEQQSAFQKAKEALASTYLLVPYDNRRPLLLAVDASPYGLGAVLAHRFVGGSERPIAFASRSLNKAERNYSQLDKEGAALVFGVKKFRNYLLGRQFEIFTDHKPLLGLFDEARAVPALASSRLQRWALLLEAYAYTMRFRPGKENANADMLSRLPLKETELGRCGSGPAVNPC